MFSAADRERHIVLKALALGIVAIDSAPQERRPASDREDMARMLDELAPTATELELYVRAAGWIINGTDPHPPEIMTQLRALQEDMEKRRKDGESEAS